LCELIKEKQDEYVQLHKVSMTLKTD